MQSDFKNFYDTSNDVEDEDLEECQGWPTVASASGVSDLSFMEYVDVDSSAPVHEVPTDADILLTVQHEDEDIDDNDEEGNSDAVDEPIPLPHEARSALEVVRRYLETSSVNTDIFTYLNKVSHAMTSQQQTKNLHQTTLTKYFST